MAAGITLSLALTGCTQAQDSSLPADLPGVAVDVGVVAIDLRSADPKDLRLGSLLYRGGISVVPASHGDVFGGLSGFKISADGARFVSMSDQGHWITGELTYGTDGNLVGVAGIRVAPMLGADGKPLTGKTEGDSEGLAFADPHDLKGDAFVSFERDHRVLRFDFANQGVAAHGMPVEAPPAITTLGGNEGLEALAMLADGRLLAIAEQGPQNENADSPAWLIDPAQPEPAGFTVKRVPPYAMTDATLLPDGRVLTLERRFSPMTGPGAQLRAFDPAAFREGATADGKLIATLFGGVTVDNMEGLAARKTDDGKTLIYIVSDDNFQRPLQRTLIMMFELAE
jgi:hypothetical protein